MRMAPEGLVTPSGPPRPDLNSRGLSEHFHSRARLCRLLVRLRRPTPHRSLRSLRRRGFAHYVRLRHYRSSLLAAASNSLTFVRGADRACCAPRKGRRGVTYVPRKWSWRPTKARLYQQPRAPRRGIGVRTRQRHLAARRRAAPPKGHWLRTRQRHLASHLIYQVLCLLSVSYEIVISSGVTRIFSGFQVSGESIWVSSRAVMRRPISLFLLSTVSGGV